METQFAQLHWAVQSVLETFLSGMETAQGTRSLPARSTLETFLSGMETVAALKIFGKDHQSLKPSLVEWKPYPVSHQAKSRNP